MRSHQQSPISGLPHTISEVTEDWSKGQSDWLELVTSGVEEEQAEWLAEAQRPG